MNEPKLGDYRFVEGIRTDVYILVDGCPQWREGQWEDLNQFRSDSSTSHWVVTPILRDNEHLIETVDGHREIVSFRP